VDYDPEILSLVTGNKGPRVWFTSDFMVDTLGRPWYGIQGIPRKGGRLIDSIVVDANEAPGTQDKTLIGDVEMGVRPRG
jgi:hypothetical protein